MEGWPVSSSAGECSSIKKKSQNECSFSDGYSTARQERHRSDARDQSCRTRQRDCSSDARHISCICLANLFAVSAACHHCRPDCVFSAIRSTGCSSCWLQRFHHQACFAALASTKVARMGQHVYSICERSTGWHKTILIDSGSLSSGLENQVAAV